MKINQEYLVLVIILVVGGIGAVVFRSNIEAEKIVVAGLCGAYALWGIGHHAAKKDLTGFIVLEYLLVGLLAGVIINGVILQK